MPDFQDHNLTPILFRNSLSDFNVKPWFRTSDEKLGKHIQIQSQGLFDYSSVCLSP